ncbi:MAG: hypothetical protein GXY58_18705 [Planctomycetaceae bacterium]|nr:hypothetical protein [Planctomycetaceae bacterium]
MRLFVCLGCAITACLASAVAAQQPAGARQEAKIDQPLTANERSAATRLTRLPSTRLWWNDENRVIGASFKGDDASDYALALASHLPGLRTVVLVATPHSHLTDDGLASLAALPNLELLSICGNRITDAALVHVARMYQLRALVLSCHITDSGLPALAELTNLEYLDLTQSQVTDAGAIQLLQFAKLRTLILNGTQITNDSLATLAELKTLEDLYLGNTLIDDGAVASLKQMEQLQLLFLRDTQFTANAVAELQPALLESCTIMHQSGTYRGTRKSPLAMTHWSGQAVATRAAP